MVQKWSTKSGQQISALPYLTYISDQPGWIHTKFNCCLWQTCRICLQVKNWNSDPRSSLPKFTLWTLFAHIYHFYHFDHFLPLIPLFATLTNFYHFLPIFTILNTFYPHLPLFIHIYHFYHFDHVDHFLPLIPLFCHFN